MTASLVTSLSLGMLQHLLHLAAYPPWPASLWLCDPCSLVTLHATHTHTHLENMNISFMLHPITGLPNVRKKIYIRKHEDHIHDSPNHWPSKCAKNNYILDSLHLLKKMYKVDPLHQMFVQWSGFHSRTMVVKSSI